MPRFLEDEDVDLLASKGGQFVAFALNKQEGFDDFGKPSGLIDASLDDDYGRSLLAEAKRLLRPDTLRSALVMGWTAFEAAARSVLRQKEVGDDKLQTRPLLEMLFSEGLISRQDYLQVKQCLSLRALK